MQSMGQWLVLSEAVRVFCVSVTLFIWVEAKNDQNEYSGSLAQATNCLEALFLGPYPVS